MFKTNYTFQAKYFNVNKSVKKIIKPISIFTHLVAKEDFSPINA
jgi:hypothetical protein